MCKNWNFQCNYVIPTPFFFVWLKIWNLAHPSWNNPCWHQHRAAGQDCMEFSWLISGYRKRFCLLANSYSGLAGGQESDCPVSLFLLCNEPLLPNSPYSNELSCALLGCQLLRDWLRSSGSSSRVQFRGEGHADPTLPFPFPCPLAHYLSLTDVVFSFFSFRFLIIFPPPLSRLSSQVEAKLIDKLDSLMSEGKGDETYRELFNSMWVA